MTAQVMKKKFCVSATLPSKYTVEKLLQPVIWGFGVFPSENLKSKIFFSRSAFIMKFDKNRLISAKILRFESN